jgi:hypothetical protein
MLTGALFSQENSALALIHCIEIPAMMDVNLFRYEFIQHLKNYNF